MYKKNEIALLAADRVLEMMPVMKTALNTYEGKLTNKAVGEAFGMEVEV